jgi:hypothetical protein
MIATTTLTFIPVTVVVVAVVDLFNLPVGFSGLNYNITSWNLQYKKRIAIISYYIY